MVGPPMLMCAARCPNTVTPDTVQSLRRSNFAAERVLIRYKLEVDKREWSCSAFRVEVGSDDLTITASTETWSHSRGEQLPLGVRRRFWRYRLLHGVAEVLTLRGCTKADAFELAAWIHYWEILPQIEETLQWATRAREFLRKRLDARRWITLEDVNAIQPERKSRELLERSRESNCVHLFSPEELSAAELGVGGLSVIVNESNEQITSFELQERKSFFDSIERTPLSEEQARAVICFDNRVQILAAAGSGKTSTMVAKAAYAVARGLVSPDRILLLAFNKAAAAELQERIEARFAAAGIPSEGVRAATFHSFGLEVIGRATERKPRLARWLEQDQEKDMVMKIVDELRDQSPTFRYDWDLYRLLFASASTSLDNMQPDGYDSATSTTGYRTASGVLVRSEGERLIADFLFFNGVEFEYERPYVHDVADATHSQYQPDFYYPGIDTWHEHWAIGRDGNPPKEFVGYRAGMLWKKELHRRYGTSLIETTWTDVVFSDGLQRLSDELTRRGETLDWNPDRPLKDSWYRTLKHEDLARLVRTFMCHVKSNSWSSIDVERRLASELSSADGYRTRLFLSLYWPIHEEWERRLAEDGSVDFEDMVVRAGELLESGALELSYDLILVDEFQDSSQARARLVRGLVKGTGCHLVVVGDDWQSINRFAGADLSVMTRFEDWFGRGPQLALSTTFRCAQPICDVARSFITKNTQQFDKPMRSSRPDAEAPITVIFSDDERSSISGLVARLGHEAPNVAQGESVSVDVLGRYGFQRDLIPRSVPDGVNLTFRTIHSSKGLEADYVIIPGMTTGTYGFPSNVVDDPVLELAMPRPETFPHAEERRLFYVALTRSRHGVYLLAPANLPSPFVVELMTDPNVNVEGNDGQPVSVCPKCRQGTLAKRVGPYGAFWGCSRFPICDYKKNAKCPDCGTGKLVTRKGRYGQFIGCSNYPECRHTEEARRPRT